MTQPRLRRLLRNSQQRCRDDEMSIGDIERITGEAVASASVYILAGGEPLMKEGILDVVRRHVGTLL